MAAIGSFSPFLKFWFSEQEMKARWNNRVLSILLVNIHRKNKASCKKELIASCIFGHVKSWLAMKTNGCNDKFFAISEILIFCVRNDWQIKKSNFLFQSISLVNKHRKHLTIWKKELVLLFISVNVKSWFSMKTIGCNQQSFAISQIWISG